MGKYDYIIAFDTEKGGQYSWVLNISGDNLKDAKEKAKEMWDKYSTAHMFHIKVKRLPATEEGLFNWFVRVDKLKTELEREWVVRNCTHWNENHLRSVWKLSDICNK